MVPHPPSTLGSMAQGSPDDAGSPESIGSGGDRRAGLRALLPGERLSVCERPTRCGTALFNVGHDAVRGMRGGFSTGGCGDRRSAREVADRGPHQGGRGPHQQQDLRPQAVQVQARRARVGASVSRARENGLYILFRRLSCFQGREVCPESLCLRKREGCRRASVKVFPPKKQAAGINKVFLERFRIV